MNSPKLLYLHNGSQPTGASALPERFTEMGLTVDYFWTQGGEFPADLAGYAGIFLSGSPHGAYDDIPYIHQEHELIQAAAQRDIPMLGVCFGSQILASALCGRDQVFRRTSCEVGFKWLPLTEAGRQDPLTAGLGDAIHMFVWHNDEVRADHPTMRILAVSDDCPNQIWRWGDRPVWGIQGHPEPTQAEARRWFEADRAYFEKDGADIAALQAAATEQPEGKIILSRFAAFCLAREPMV